MLPKDSNAWHCGSRPIPAALQGYFNERLLLTNLSSVVSPLRQQFARTASMTWPEAKSCVCFAIMARDRQALS